MIKFESIGAISAAKNNPTITSVSTVKNYDFITYEDTLYLIMNIVNGDDSYREGITFAAGTYLRGIDVKSLEGLKLIVDDKHITGGVTGKTVGTTLVAHTDGTLKTGTATSGVYFKVTKVGLTLTEAAIEVKVCVADADTTVTVPTSISDLTDVDTTGASEGQVLKLNASGKWAPAADATE